MSDDSERPDPKDGGRWWANGRWAPIPRALLDPESSGVTFAVSIDDYPDLAELVQFADDPDRYLRMLGVSEEALDVPNEPFTLHPEDEPYTEGEESGLDA